MAIGREWTVDRKLLPGEVLMAFPRSALYQVPGLERLLRLRHLDEWSDGVTCYVVLDARDAEEARLLVRRAAEAHARGGEQ